ncbi:hypothetical protein EGK_04220 [Macaca mulatta]|uniref:Sodium/calcium exchanger membrane region domain-containing protein n=1 Tax=Macaca mulatta TaxID=9544 RepID=G7N5Q1_MACMU|nr:hypothetical protein EGK_04220 [Macaca mulatta]
MASRWLDLRWALSVLCVLLMAETVSGARDSSTGAHISPQFPASGVNQTPVVDCRKVCGLNVSDRCDFIRTNPDCHSDGGYVDYLEGIFCHFPPNLLPLAVTLYVRSCPGGLVSWLLYLFLILGVTAAKFALVAFSDPHTAGLALGALFGESSPGAGVLVTTVVAGGITILHPFMAASRPFFRDIVFYMVAVFLTFIMLFRGRVTMAWALGYLGLYVFYVVTVILCTWIYRWQRRGSLVYSMPVTPEILSDSEEDQVSSNSNSYDYGDEYRPLFFYQETTAQILARALNPLDYMKWRRKSAYWKALKVFKLPVEFLLLLTVPVVDPDKDDRNWKRPLNCLHLVISPLVVVLTLQSGTYGVYEIGGLVPVWVVVVIAGTALASVTFFATSDSQPPKLHWLFAFLGFLTSALWINAAATEVVNILRSLGVVFRLSNTVLGLTLLAWGNSIGDAFSDFTLARQGYPRMAFSACFGGIIFSILCGLFLALALVSQPWVRSVPCPTLRIGSWCNTWGRPFQQSFLSWAADILVGVGLGCLLQISRSHTEVKLEPDGLLVWVLAGALGLSLVFSLVSVPLQCFQLSRVYGICLLLFYLNFLVVALLTEFGVIRLKST